MIDLYRARHLDAADPMQSAACGASALGAVGRAAENARLDARFKIG